MGTESQGQPNEDMPISAEMPQYETTAVPYRDEPAIAFRPDAELEEEFPKDYLTLESERLGDPQNAAVARDKANEWSEGIADEANDQGFGGFNELDAESDAGAALPEMQPLMLDTAAPIVPDIPDAEVELNPDNVQHGIGTPHTEHEDATD